MKVTFIGKYFKKPLFFLCLMQAVFLHTREGNPRFQHISIQDGLSQNTINCILQDSTGFMWFGTEDGLNKYDGYGFSIIKNNPQDSRSLSGNFILTIFEDRSGTLWFGTSQGLNRYNPKSNSFTRFLHDPDNPRSLSNNIVGSICEDRSGALWVGTLRGLNRYNPKTGSFTRFLHDPNDPRSLPHNSIRSIAEDKSGFLWIGTGGGGLLKYNPETEKFLQFLHNPRDANSLSSNSIHRLCIGNSGAIWVGTVDGLSKFAPESDTFIRFTSDVNDPGSLSSNLIKSILEDKSGALWIGTRNGLNRFEPGSETFTRFLHDPNNPNSLSQNNGIDSLYEDRSGTLWVGTDGAGLNKLDHKSQKFAHYFHNPNDTTSLSNNFVWSIYESGSGEFWIGTSEGLNKFDLRSRKSTRFTISSHVPYGLSNNNVRAIIEDKSGNFWIGTIRGLNKYDPRTGKFQHYFKNPDDPKQLSDDFIRTLELDESGNLWIGTNWGGLHKFNPNTKKFSRLSFESQNSFSSTSYRRIMSLCAGKTGILWVGTDGAGLIGFDSKKETFKQFLCNPRDPHTLSSNFITSIVEDKSGTLWIGTFGSGLNKFDPLTGMASHWTEIDGLPNNVVYGILVEDDGYSSIIWLSTNNGIAKFNTATGKFRSYDYRDGLQSNEFNIGAFHKSKNGQMFFGGVNGFNSFFPDNIKDNPFIPPVVILDFQLLNKSIAVGEKVNGHVILTEPIFETEKITLSHKDRAFSFEFVALNYDSPEKNMYAYMMEGFDKDWNYWGNRRFVTYTTLPPGSYVFRVKGSNNDGIWNEEGASLKIIISPPFWQTWWFRTLLISGILVLAVSIHMIRTRFLINRKEELDRIEKLSRIARRGAIIAHEINNPLFAIANSIQVIKKMTGSLSPDVKKVVDLTENEITRLRKIIKEFTRMKLNQFEKSEIVKILNSAIRVLKWGKKLGDTNILIKPKNRSFPLICNSESLQQVFMNIILNSIESMQGKGKLSIEVSSQENFYEIHFIDTGPGFNQAVKDKLFEPFSSQKHGGGTGLGLFISYNIIKKHKGEIILDEGYSRGAHIIVKIPRNIKSADV